MSVPDVVRRITTALDAAGIAYMLTGSFASAHYGTPRSTQDIDLVIEATASQLRVLVDLLEGRGYYVEFESALDALRNESLFNVIDINAGWKIDLIIRKSRRFSKEEFSRRRRADVQGTPIFVASAEDVVIAKLEWSKLGGSLRQIEDAAAIIRIQADALDIPYLQKWVTELKLEDQWEAAKRAPGFLQ
jgi:hypothetical protein